MRLEKRTALVTGGGQGIGQAICDRLAAEGARVAVLDLNGESAERVAAQLRERGAETIALQANVANRKQVRAAVARAIAELGHLDILVNNAGIARHQYLDDMPEGDWDDVMNVNAKATFHFCQAVVPHMKERGGGKIVNLASRAILGNARETNYSAAKAAVVGFSRALSLEVAAHNINVNCVSPSMVDTPWTQAYPEEMRQRAIKLIPKGRPALPREIANVVLFLVSDDAEYVTGQTLHVCGGRSVGMNPW
ncbi:MAG: SDR family oxidoreductase [Chloroflexi bacterium]|nr:SDR family oxidoreductase [Chloroflexota bacterium]